MKRIIYVLVLSAMAFLALVLSVFSTVGCFYLAHRLGVLRKDFKEKP